MRSPNLLLKICFIFGCIFAFALSFLTPPSTLSLLFFPHFLSFSHQTMMNDIITKTNRTLEYNQKQFVRTIHIIHFAAGIQQKFMV